MSILNIIVILFIISIPVNIILAVVQKKLDNDIEKELDKMQKSFNDRFERERQAMKEANRTN